MSFAVSIDAAIHFVARVQSGSKMLPRAPPRMDSIDVHFSKISTLLFFQEMRILYHKQYPSVEEKWHGNDKHLMGSNMDANSDRCLVDVAAPYMPCSTLPWQLVTHFRFEEGGVVVG